MADKITTDVIESAVIPSVHTLLQKARVIWTSHVAWKPDSRLKSSYWIETLGRTLRTSTWLAGRRNFLKTASKSLSKTCRSTPVLRSHSQDRPAWTSKVTTEARAAENNGPQKYVKNAPRAKIEQPPHPLQHPHTHVPCVRDPSGLDQFGLTSHLQTHRC